MSKDEKPQNKNSELKEGSRELATIQDAAGFVASYANKLVGSDRAQQFYAQVAVMARQNEKIAQATPESLLNAMMACVHLDLMPNTPEQLAYIIPYWNKKTGKYEVQFQIGYQGLLDLARRSGEIVALNAELVYAGDEFDVELGTERKITHKPDFEVDRTDYSKVTHAYVTSILTGGQKGFHVMTRKQLDKIKESAKASSTDAPWSKWPEEMAKKTVVKNAAKVALPKSRKDNRLALATHIDSLAEAGRLKVDTKGEIIEGEAVDQDAAKAERVKRIKNAEATREKMESGDHTPQAVESADEETKKK